MAASEQTSPVHTRALIIGAGISGIGMAIELQKRNVEFLIVEESDDIGGTWYFNTYPGIACDIPSHFYSYSFEPKADWKHLYSYGDEIEEYLRGIGEKYDLRSHVKFNTHVNRAVWDENECRWHVFAEDGREFVAQFLISGVGALHIPSIPDFKGLDEFEGNAFHSSKWDHSAEFKGKRVAVIGTGASAIQIVPGILKEDYGIAELQVYQRTPSWVLPLGNPKIPPYVQWLFKYVPGARRAFRLSIYLIQESLAYGMNYNPDTLKMLEKVSKSYMEKHIKDPEVREKLTPKYRAGYKRLGKLRSFFLAFNDPRVQLITEGVSRFTPKGIVTDDGTEREVDIVVLATGFHVTDAIGALEIRGLKGVNLSELWDQQGMRAYKGITVDICPNLFMLLGPNTGLGHNSVIYMIESQIKYVGQAITTLDEATAADPGIQALAPKREALVEFNEELQKKLAPTVWATGGGEGTTQNYYTNRHGDIDTLWPGFTWMYRRAVRKFNSKEYLYFGRRRSVRK